MYGYASGNSLVILVYLVYQCQTLGLPISIFHALSSSIIHHSHSATHSCQLVIMGKPLWTSGMLNVVLEHVEEHKGKEGLYNTDRDAAYKDSRLRVCKGYPRRPVSVEQLKKQLEYVVRLHRRPEYIQDDGNKMELLYREGRKILRPECSQEQLLLRERQGRFGVKSAKKGSTAPPYAPAYRSPQTERDPSSSLSPSSETYEFTNGSYKSMAPYPNSTPMENFEATRDFLAVSPEVFLPSRKFLDQLRDHTIEGIRSAAYDFIDSTGVHSEMIPQLYKSLRSPSFADICKRVYDASTNEELLGKFASLQSMSALSLVDFIRALMAAVITDWIFEGSHAPFAMELMQKSQPQVMYENIIAEREINIFLLDCNLWQKLTFP